MNIFLTTFLTKFCRCCQSIKHAIQTRVVAKRFDESWLFNEKLDFGADFSRLRGHTELLLIVSKVFTLHKGPKTQSFQLYMDHMCMEWRVEHWVKTYLEKRLRSSTWTFSRGEDPFVLPTSLLDSECLRILKLTNCNLHSPSKLKGLGFLATLILKMVNVTEKLIQGLFNNCLLLETMGLTQCPEITHLKVVAGNLKNFKWLRVENCPELVKIHIDAPTLCTMYFSGAIQDFTFGNVLGLKDMTLNINNRGFPLFTGIEKFMLDLSHVPVLGTTAKLVKGLSPRAVNGNLEVVVPFCLWNRKKHELFGRGMLCGPSCVVTFMDKCPCLEKVIIRLDWNYFALGFFWEAHEGQSFEELNISFKSLKSIRISGFKFATPILKVANFFLEKARTFPTLELNTTDSGESEIVEAMLPTDDHLQSLYQAYP